jgi:hypothetical protein
MEFSSGFSLGKPSFFMKGHDFYSLVHHFFLKVMHIHSYKIEIVLSSWKIVFCFIVEFTENLKNTHILKHEQKKIEVFHSFQMELNSSKNDLL